MENKKSENSIKNITYNLAFLIIIGLIIIFLLSIRIGNVVSGSMQPALQIGSNVLYNTWASLDSVENGDIVVYKSSKTGRLVIHRVIDIKYNTMIDKPEKQLIVKGDNNTTYDEERVTKSNYVGCVCFSIQSQKINTLLNTLSNKKGLLRVICIIIIILILIITIKSRTSSVKQVEQPEEQPDLIIKENEGIAEQSDINCKNIIIFAILILVLGILILIIIRRKRNEKENNNTLAYSWYSFKHECNDLICGCKDIFKRRH